MGEQVGAGFHLIVLLAGLLLWWIFWAILIDEDENEQSLPETEQIE